MNGSCHWVVALKPEAQALIEHLSLKYCAETSGGGFSVYQDEDKNHRLVISGIGKINAAAATVWLAATGNPDHPASWINFGIAGNRTAERGTILRAGRVTDQATHRSWYPVATWPKKQDRFEVTEIETVDTPTVEYPDPRKTIEMEAAGFVPSALRFSGAELVQVIKVISDNETTDIADLKPAKIKEICSRAVSEVVDWAAECLAPIAGEVAERLANPPGWEDLTETYHFTETQKHQLKRLLQRAAVLDVDWEKATIAKENARGKDILLALESLLTNTKGTKD